MGKTSLAIALTALFFAVWLPPAAQAERPPSQPGVDAPALAALGPFPVGVESPTWTQAAQADPLAYDAKTGVVPKHDRILPMEIWYPATPKLGARPVTYEGSLPGEDGKDVAFTIPGVAVRGAPPRAGAFPLVILAHGYSGTPVAMSWLAENLASKGYVVAAPHFRDPLLSDTSKVAGPLARRPLDIAFVAAEAARLARARLGVFASVDASRVALIGYSMGGYGVVTDAGAPLNPVLGGFTHGVLSPYVAGGADAAALKIAGLKAVVAISPAGRFGPLAAWGSEGLAAITAPTLFIVGDHDHIVGFDPGVKTLFKAEIHAPRYLLSFENADHDIGMGGEPGALMAQLWDQDWFEDPVWRKDRLMAIQQHFITAFLDLYVKGDASRASYIDGLTQHANDGAWPAAPGGRYDAISPGPPVTLWKGFPRNHATGLDLVFLPAAQ